MLETRQDVEGSGVPGGSGHSRKGSVINPPLMQPPRWLQLERHGKAFSPQMLHHWPCHSPKPEHHSFGVEEFVTSMTCRWSGGAQCLLPLNPTGSGGERPSGEGKGSGLQGQ